MRICVSPDALRAVAKQQTSILNSIAEETAKVNDLSDQLGEAWEGASGAQAQNALEEIRTVMKNVIDGATACAQKLLSVADAFESIDNGERAYAVGVTNGGIIPMLIRKSDFFMPGMVRIDTDRVRDIAEQCKIISATISESSTAYSDSIRDLSNDWEGRSYIKYEEETNEVITALREIEDAMMEFISRIVNAANLYEEIDNSL